MLEPEELSERFGELVELRPAKVDSGSGGPSDAAGPVPPSARRPRSTEPPPPLSRFALREDGAAMLSTEDAADRDLTGRECQTFLVLTSEETAQAREIADDGIAAAAARLIAGLPKRAR